MDVKNFIDLHVHIGPELLPRKFTVPSIIEAERGKIRGMALKSHFFPTIPLIKSVNIPENLMLLGSLTLNAYQGGLNPDIIYASAKLSKNPLLVWFPTINSETFLKRSEYEIPPEWVSENFKSRKSSEVKTIKIVDDKNNLLPDTIAVLKEIKRNNCILLTGHLSGQESKILVDAALVIGINKIIITHPIYQRIDMPISMQRELTQNNGVYVEQSYSMYSIDKIPIEKIAMQIKEVGAKNCIITSDVGQVSSPPPSQALKEFCNLLQKQDISENDLKLMGAVNPRKLLEF